MTIEESAKKYRLILAQNLKRFINEKQWSQNEFARQMGVTSTIASAWCRAEKYPSSENLNKMCKLFSCHMIDLVEDQAEIAKFRRDLRLREYASLLMDRYDLQYALDQLQKVPQEDMDKVIELIRVFAKEKK